MSNWNNFLPKADAGIKKESVEDKMNTKYTAEENTLILIALMKAHGVRKVIVSPGTTNISFVASIQQDAWFELYSAADERSAAYMACGLAAESGEPVALSCTGATASRNYIPGLTEAFYRKLPVLAITSTQHTGRVGQLVAQVIDRSQQLNDMVKLSVQLPMIHSEEDRWTEVVSVNQALLELKRHGGGPVHINLTTTYCSDFSVAELPKVRKIERFLPSDQLPAMPKGKVAVFIGQHAAFTKELTEAVDAFCASHNAIVLCDQTSNYRGKYCVLASIASAQRKEYSLNSCNVLIHIGNVSGAYMGVRADEVWRVNQDGEIRDTFKKLHYVFEMDELAFFKSYLTGESGADSFIKEANADLARLRGKLPDLPFSNLWVASKTALRIPDGSVLHLGILNTLRAWNYFETPSSVSVYSNTGGFGIDGLLSTLVGAALANPQKLYFGVIGDLAFFYDMNALGNRHLGKNVRLMVINNGCGTEFKNYNHHAARFGEDGNPFMAAEGHYGHKSPLLLKNYAENLGCKYLSASSKEEYLQSVEEWLSPEIGERPIVFEVFTNYQDESDALKMMNTIEADAAHGAKELVKGILGEKGVKAVKSLLKR